MRADCQFLAFSICRQPSDFPPWQQGAAVTRWRRAAPSNPASVSKKSRGSRSRFERRSLSRKEPSSVWKGQLGNSRAVERGQSQKSVVPLGGTEGSNHSSAESGANVTFGAPLTELVRRG